MEFWWPFIYFEVIPSDPIPQIADKIKLFQYIHICWLHTRGLVHISELNRSNTRMASRVCPLANIRSNLRYLCKDIENDGRGKKILIVLIMTY